MLYGPNAQGKTTILEAIYLMAIARSFRAENEREVVNWEAVAQQSDAIVGATIHKGSEVIKVVVGYHGFFTSEVASRGRVTSNFSVRKQIRVGKTKKSAVELVGIANAVLFSSEDLNLVHGPPALRRRYLDILLSQADSRYLKALQRYQQVLHQRNQLLKLLIERRAGQDELQFWDIELAREGSWVLWERYQALLPLSQSANECHTMLTGDQQGLSLVYKPSVALADFPHSGQHGDWPDLEKVQDSFMYSLERTRERERIVGSTLIGPHRDDFSLTVAGADVGTYGSRGQIRTVALTLRLAEAFYLTTQQQDGPIILLDDVLSELDQVRRALVLKKVTEYQQVIITTTDLELLGRDFLRQATCLHVKDGLVSSPE